MGVTIAGQGSPVIVPDQPIIHLDEIGWYEVGYALRGGPEVHLPLGWTGGLDSPTGAACQSAGKQNGQEAWLLHCPWRGKTGVTFQDFTIALPRVSKIVLAGATALRADGVGKSDGVTFRVFVNGVKRLDVNQADAAWRSFALDLTPEQGQTVKLRFETDPGPRDNPSFDFALWGSRRLVLSGYQSRAMQYRPLPPLDLRKLTSQQNGSVVPLAGCPEKIGVQVNVKSAVLRAQGTDGVLEYRWIPGDGKANFLGNLTLQATETGGKPMEISLAQQAHFDWVNRPIPTNTELISVPGGARLTRAYMVGGQSATVTVTATLIGKSLELDVSCDRPVIRAFAGGAWGPTMYRRQINLPYYSLPISYLPHENLFAGAFLDWTTSQASSLDGTTAAYDSRTDNTRNLLHERLIYTAAWQLAETLPNIPNPPSPFRADLSKRVILDIWGGTFSDVQAHIQTQADSGIGLGIALLHVWQHSGYDNALPTHVPANTEQGGDSTLRSLTQTAQRDGIRMALHENYVDYYPNYAGFTASDIALDPNGERVRAWFNPGTKIQSFAIKPTHILTLAQTQSPETVRRYGSNACYLDVHSAVPPWFHVDFDAKQPGAGLFSTVWDSHRALWAYERQLHNGPVFGEGNNHWYWSGYLDGVEAQFGQGWPSNQGTSAPLLVDFDLLKIHPLQLNHGMGYYERWWDQGPSPERGLLSLLDQYRMQEATYGHEGFLGGDAWYTPSLAWLESHLMTPLTVRSALAAPTAIDYLVGGRWAGATEAAKSGSDWTQVRIRYDNGLTLWANGGNKPLKIGDTTLPQFGWLAQGAGLTQAGTLLNHGIVSDIAETADSVFVNARPASDWQTPGQTRIRPTVAQFTPTGPRSFRATYRWAVGQNTPADYHCFVHFAAMSGADTGENIRFQQDHLLPLPTSHWKTGQAITDGPWVVRVPDGVPTGDYQWLIGLYQESGGRLTLQGRSDPHQRIILGTLHVRQFGVSFTAAPPEPHANAPVNFEAQVLDFGSIRTNGSVFVQRAGDDWTLRPYPHDRAFTVELAAARFGRPPAVQTGAGLIQPINDGAWWRLTLNSSSVYRWHR